MTMTKSRISRSLLAGTVLTAAPITALNAATITETIDFTPNPNIPFALPVGTTQVDGTIGFNGDQSDAFLFEGLGAGTYTLTFTSDSFCGGVVAYSNVGILSNLGTYGTGCESVLATVFSTGTVPANGKLVVSVQNEEGAASYSVSLTAPLAETETVPEPSTFAAGLLAGGAMLWRRRRAKAN